MKNSLAGLSLMGAMSACELQHPNYRYDGYDAGGDAEAADVYAPECRLYSVNVGGYNPNTADDGRLLVNGQNIAATPVSVQFAGADCTSVLSRGASALTLFGTPLDRQDGVARSLQVAVGVVDTNLRFETRVDLRQLFESPSGGRDFGLVEFRLQHANLGTVNGLSIVDTAVPNVTVSTRTLSVGNRQVVFANHSPYPAYINITDIDPNTGSGPFAHTANRMNCDFNGNFCAINYSCAPLMPWRSVLTTEVVRGCIANQWTFMILPRGTYEYQLPDSVVRAMEREEQGELHLHYVSGTAHDNRGNTYDEVEIGFESR